MNARPGGMVRFHSVPPWLLQGGVLALVAAVYLPTLGFDLVYDDGWTLMANGFLRRPADLPLLFTPDAVRLHIPDAFRPTLVIFDMLTYQLFGLSASWHHATSIALHLAAVVAVHAWLTQEQIPVRIRLVTTALFGVLAIHAEAVAVVSFREDLLAAGLGVFAMALATHATHRPSRRRGHWSAVVLLQAAACGAKMSAAPLALFWWMVTARNPWRHPPARLGPRVMSLVALGLGTALAIAHRIHLHGGLVPYGADNLRLAVQRQGLGPTLAESARIHLGYLQQIVLPLGFSPEYVDRGASWTDPAVALSVAGLASLVAYGLWGLLSRRRPVAGIVIVGWFLLALPTSNLFAMPNMRADRFMYLPSLPLCLGLAMALVAAGRRLAVYRRHRTLWLAPALIYVVVQGAAAQAAARVYRSDLRLWEIALHRAPDSARAHALATLLRVGAIQRSRERRARVDPLLLARLQAHCRIAERLDPFYELSHLCFAELALAQGQWTAAYQRLGRALQLSPDRNDGLLAAMAEVALDLPLDDPKRQALALGHLDRGLREYPYSTNLLAAAGRVHHRLGQPRQALQLYRRARALRPERWEVVAWGVELALDLGDAAAARRTWTRYAPLLQQADPVLRSALQARLGRAERLGLDHTVLPSGVFPP